MKLRATALFVIIGVIWGSTWLLHGGSYQSVPLLCAGAMRFALAAILLGVTALVSRAFRKNRASVEAPILLPSALLGMLLLALPYACSVGASHAGVAAGLPAGIYAAMPLAVVLFLELDVTPQLPVLLMGLAGVSLLVLQGLQLDWTHWRGEALLLGGMAANALALAYAVRGGQARLQALASLRGIAVQCAVAAGVLAIFAAVSGQLQWQLLAGHWAAPGLNSWLAVIAEAVISSITLPMMYLLLRYSGAVPVAAVQWLVTLTGAVEAACFLQFRPVWENWAGLVLTITALCLMLYRGQHPRQYPASLG